MRVEYDPVKNSRNIAERGLSFEEVIHLDWRTAVYNEDMRKDYGEARIRAIVNDHHGTPHHVTFTLREAGEVMRIISFRLAREKERKQYEKENRSL